MGAVVTGADLGGVSVVVVVGGGGVVVNGGGVGATVVVGTGLVVGTGRGVGGDGARVRGATVLVGTTTVLVVATVLVTATGGTVVGRSGVTTSVPTGGPASPVGVLSGVACGSRNTETTTATPANAPPIVTSSAGRRAGGSGA